jgi:hypothetical protein
MQYPKMRDTLLRLTSHCTGRRSLGVSLLYNHTCPVLYEPAGFASSPDTDTSSFNDPSTATDHVGKFHVGYYQIAVTAGHVKPIQDEAGGRSPVPEIISNGGSTKDSTSSRLEDLAIKRQLQAMQRSSSIPSNLISTQIERALKSTHTASQNVSQSALSAAMPGQRGSGIAVDWDSRRKLNVTPTKMAELIVQAWGLEAHNQSYVYMLDIDLLRKSNKIKRLNPGKDVRCECGSDHERDAMVGCANAVIPRWRLCWMIHTSTAQSCPYKCDLRLSSRLGTDCYRHSANSAGVGNMISAMGFRGMGHTKGLMNISATPACFCQQLSL